MDIIDCFEGNYEFLSNFYNAPITYEGLTFMNSESAYQSCKAVMEEDRLKFTNLIGAKAKRLGRKMPYTKRFDDNKLIYMYEIVSAKFTQNEDLASRLLATGNSEIVEGNYWHDTFWGVCNGEGSNHLGKILMRVRSELRQRMQ